MKIVRKLGFGELRMHLFHKECYGTTQGALNVRVTGSFDAQNINQTIVWLLDTLPNLALTIDEIDGEYYFLANESTSISNNYFEIITDDDLSYHWPQLLTTINNQLLDSSRQLWKLYVVTNTEKVTDFVLVMHHALMDAQSSETFLDLFFSKLAGCASCAEEFIQQQKSMFPALEENAITACSWEKFLEIQQSVRESIATISPTPHIQSPPLEERSTDVQYFSINASLTEELKRACQKQQISINSLFSAILLQSSAQLLNERSKFALFSAISLRDFCSDVSDTSLGCYLSVAPTFHNIDNVHEDGLVALAKEHKVELQKSFLNTGRWIPESYDTQGVKSSFAGLLNAEAFMNDLGLTYAQSGLKEQYGSLSIVHQYVIARRHIGNVAAIVHGLESAGNIYFTLSHVSPLQSSQWAESLKELFLSKIHDFVHLSNIDQPTSH